ncbi:Abi family protein [Hungatella effluvii]|uniref:Abi family protein n=1 Tax=Hungatella effluvii TaxID=1096246 RepID=UPI0022DEB279|nr:Abi family protein [Hungatella effluvii]
MPKPFMTYEQQIQKLRDKNLTITDEDEAMSILKQDGYYALITGYKDLFKNSSTKDYRDGTTLHDILTLYQFDERLRELTLRHLLHIERHIRSSLSYAFCERFGDQQSAYLNSANYDNTVKKKNAINRLITKHLTPLLKTQTRYPFLEHNKKAHGNVPLWVLVNALSFGTLSKMYELSAPQIQYAISRDFIAVNEKQLGQILDVLTDYRNLCAHNERMFSHRCGKKDIPDLPLHKKLGIPMRGNYYLHGKRDYFAVVLAFRYLLPNSEFLRYKLHLNQLIEKAVNDNQQISRNNLLSIMGFPQNWKKVTSYRKV